MKSSRLWAWTLTAAGLLQISLVLAHFGLPTMFDWSSSVGDSLPPLLRWALFALNFSWSTLVLLVGGLTLYVGRLDPTAPSVRTLVVIVAVFWTVHGIYMVVEPMPVPPRLAWIQAPVVAFPASVILLSGLAWLSTKRSATAKTTAAA